MELLHADRPKSPIGLFGLSGCVLSPYQPDSRAVEKKNMKAVIVGFVGAGSQIGAIIQAYDASNNSIGVFQENFSLAYADATPTDYINDIVPQLVPGLNADTTLTYSASDFSMVWGQLMSRSFSNPSLAINTSRQASASRDALVVASVEIDATLSLTSGAKGTVTLKYADDSAFTTNVVTASVSPNGNTGTLSIGINTVGSGAGPVVGIIPAGKYYRLVTTNVTGTPTYGTPSIQEVLL